MPDVKYLDTETLRQALPWPQLINAVEDIFRSEVVEPVRHHHTLQVPGDPQATLLLMPAWTEGGYLGVKQVAVFPGNSARHEPALNSSYMLSSAITGKPLLQLDADLLTAQRTAAASALASRYLSRPTSNTLLMMGAGRLARALIEAHCTVRPIKKVYVWNRNMASAEKLVDELRLEGKTAEVCPPEALEDIVAQTDIVSCATMATTAILRGEWLPPGIHVDLVGAFRPDMRETDTAAISRANVFVDTRAGALAEAGDLVQARTEGGFSEEDVVAEFSELCSGQHSGREALADKARSITLFKSVGAAREDLAAAMLAYENSREQ